MSTYKAIYVSATAERVALTSVCAVPVLETIWNHNIKSFGCVLEKPNGDRIPSLRCLMLYARLNKISKREVLYGARKPRTQWGK